MNIENLYGYGEKSFEDRYSVMRRTTRNKQLQLSHVDKLGYFCWYNWANNITFLDKSWPSGPKLLNAQEDADFFRAQALHHLLAEAHSEARESIFTVVHGSYKLAAFSLRNTLELSLLGLYSYDHYREYQDSFIEEKRRTPSFREALRYIFGKSPFQEFDLMFSLQEQISSTYDRLSRFVHTRGLDRNIIMYSGQTSLSEQAHDELFDQWYSDFCEVADVTNTSLILSYPEVINPKPGDRFYTHYKINANPFWCLEILSEERLKQLKQVLT